MKIQEINILFFTRTMELGGTENVILQLCEIFKPYVNSIVVCSCGGVNVKKLNELGINHYVIGDIQHKNIKSFISTIRTIYAISKKHDINVIHSHHRMAALYSQFVLKKNVIKLANVHNTFVDRKLLSKLAYFNTILIAVGEQVKRNLIEVYKQTENKITVIHNAIKPFDDEIRVLDILQKARKDNKVIIGNVSRLSKQKGLLYYIEAAEIVHGKIPNSLFVLVGSGEDEQDLKKVILKKDMSEYFLFLGYRNDVQNVISQLDFVVLSSLWEGLPLTPIEAFSVRKTIVATNVDGTPEIIDDGINGFLVPKEDSFELAKKIIYLILNTNLRYEFETNAYMRYVDEFSFEVFKKNYLDFYLTLVDG